MGSINVQTVGAESCERMAAHLGRCFAPPVCFALCGDLGAGKTTFVRGLVRGLGSDERVKSPTFAIACSYTSEPVVHHLDLYRLDDEEACVALGLEEMVFDERALSCVEWADRWPGLLTGGRSLVVRFPSNASDERIVQLTLGPELESEVEVERLQSELAASALSG